MRSDPSTSRQTRECHRKNSPTNSVSKEKVPQVPSKSRKPTSRNLGGQRRMKSRQALAGAGPSSKRPMVTRRAKDFFADAYTHTSIWIKDPMALERLLSTGQAIVDINGQATKLTASPAQDAPMSAADQLSFASKSSRAAQSEKAIIAEPQSSIKRSAEKTVDRPRSSRKLESYVKQNDGVNHSHAYKPVDNVKNQKTFNETSNKNNKTKNKTSNKAGNIIFLNIDKVYIDKRSVNGGKKSGANKETSEN